MAGAARQIVAILLAAGEGRRAGRPKALLPIGGTSFLAHAASLFDRRGIEAVVAVLGHAASRVRSQAGLSGCPIRLIENPEYSRGMLSSVLAGLEEAERLGADAVLLHPVDHPLVEAETIDAVVGALQRGARIAVPTHHGRRGHPAGFGSPTWPALRSAPPDGGARAVLAEHPDWVVHLDGGPGCVAGINTPEDYERLLGVPLP